MQDNRDIENTTDKPTEAEAPDKTSDLKGGLREEPELWKIIGSSKEIKDVFKNIQTVSL